MSEYIDFYSKVNGLWETTQFESSVDVHEFSAYLNHSGFPCIASNGTLQLSTSTGEIMKSTYEGCCSSDEFRNSLLADDEGRFHLLRTTYYNLCYTRQITPYSGIRLEMPGHAFKRHETIYLNAYVRSTDEQVRTIPLCILLEYQQNYWFWPEWSNQFHVEYVDMNEKGSALLAVPSFSYQESPPQPLEGLTFWGALLNDDMTEILGGVDGIGKWQFSIN